MNWIQCLLCDNDVALGTTFCSRCIREMNFLTRARNEPAEKMPGFYLYAHCQYEGAWANFIRLVKSQPHRYLNEDLLNLFTTIVQYWLFEIRHLGFDAVAAVPGQPGRRRLGFSLSAWLSAQIATQLNVVDLSERLGKRWTAVFREQKRLAVLERRQSVNHFVWKGRELKRPLRVLLVDDVCTTGASLNHCRETLKRAGAECQDAWVLARTPKNQDRLLHTKPQNLRSV